MSYKQCPNKYSPEMIKSLQSPQTAIQHPCLQNGTIKETEPFDSIPNEGIKYDSGKPRLDLIPSEVLIELGKVLEFGARKYSPGNWAKGIPNSRLLAASLRHLAEFMAGRDIDEESGLNHISHCLCNLAFLSYNIKNRADLDDRWIKNV